MCRTLDGAALEAELLRGRVIVDRRMRIVSLRLQHLARLAPRPDQRLGGLGDLGVECVGGHDVLHWKP